MYSCLFTLALYLFSIRTLAIKFMEVLILGQTKKEAVSSCVFHPSFLFLFVLSVARFYFCLLGV